MASVPTPPEDILSSWSHLTTAIPGGGLSCTQTASPAHRQILARSLNLNTLDRLEAAYRVTAVAGGGWRLSGKVRAQYVQACIVTLEPVACEIEEPFNVEFWRELDDAGEAGEDRTILDGPDQELLEHDTIPVGRIVFETLSAAIDPYPRKPGVTFDWQDQTNSDPRKNNPFSVLARFKDKS